MDTLLQAANRQFQLLTPERAGLTVGYGVIVREGQEQIRRALVHEFVHVAQSERLGGMEGFVRQYLTELIDFGHDEAPLEHEARRRTAAIMGPGD